MGGDRRGADRNWRGRVSLLAPTLEDARGALRDKFGFDDFLPGQAEIIDAVLAGRDALAVMPTGSGKSLLYQLPAAMGLGLVVVASPLIALMRDQLRALSVTGVRAAALHSGQDDDEAIAALSGVASGRVKLLYAAPERLAQEGTLELLRAARVKLFAIDEAHCVSQWGHEFRPDYGQLGEIARKLGAPPILAVTATAGPRTRADIVASLFAKAPAVFIRSFARPNLRLSFRPRGDALRQIAEFARAHEGASGIVYRGMRHKADYMARDLVRLGFDALPYHAGLDAATRTEHQDAFFSRQGVVMVATIAFGMGVDKHDVRFVAHADLPNSVEGYYQEIGRAGRDGASADTLALFDPRELAQRWRLPASIADDATARAEFERRKAMALLCVTPSCRVKALLAFFGEASGACGRCDKCRGGLLAAPRRLGALALGWRAAIESRLAALGEGGEAEPEPESAALAGAVDEASIAPDSSPPLRVCDERLLRELVSLRLSIARRRRVAPRVIASDGLLEELATKRPRETSDPLFSHGEGAALARADAEEFARAIENPRDA